MRIMIPRCELHPDTDSDPEFVGMEVLWADGKRYRFDPCAECGTRIIALLGPFVRAANPQPVAKEPKTRVERPVPDLPGLEWWAGEVAHAERVVAHAVLNGNETAVCPSAKKLTGRADDSVRRCGRCLVTLSALVRKQSPLLAQPLAPQPEPESGPMDDPWPDPKPYALREAILRYVNENVRGVSMRKMHVAQPSATFDEVRREALTLLGEGRIKRDKSGMFSRVKESANG